MTFEPTNVRLTAVDTAGNTVELRADPETGRLEVESDTFDGNIRDLIDSRDSIAISGKDGNTPVAVRVDSNGTVYVRDEAVLAAIQSLQATSGALNEVLHEGAYTADVDITCPSWATWVKVENLDSGGWSGFLEVRGNDGAAAQYERGKWWYVNTLISNDLALFRHTRGSLAIQQDGELFTQAWGGMVFHFSTSATNIRVTAYNGPRPWDGEGGYLSGWGSGGQELDEPEFAIFDDRAGTRYGPWMNARPYVWDEDISRWHLQRGTKTHGQWVDIRRDVYKTLRTQLDYDGRTDSNPVYIGQNTQGAADTDTDWEIKRITYDITNRAVDIQFLIGAWDQRATLGWT